MKDFEPTDNFVPRVMADINAYEASRHPVMTRMEELRFSRPLRYILSAGGVLLGVVNIIRMAFTFLSPALCK